MSDRKNADETASDLLGSAAQRAASDLLDLAAQLAGLAEDSRHLPQSQSCRRQHCYSNPTISLEQVRVAVSEAPLVASRNAARSDP